MKASVATCRAQYQCHGDVVLWGGARVTTPQHIITVTSPTGSLSSCEPCLWINPISRQGTDIWSHVQLKSTFHSNLEQKVGYGVRGHHIVAPCQLRGCCYLRVTLASSCLLFLPLLEELRERTSLTCTQLQCDGCGLGLVGEQAMRLKLTTTVGLVLLA